ncbi:GGDEF domain-containing protein [Candidatus Uhrbacteria bacterium]|nr:GGDEF domain-containing protein [Candidatus Uhrbacteria bacterium]
MRIVELEEALKREREKRRSVERRVTLDALTRLQTRRAFDTDGKARFRRAKEGHTSVGMFFLDANGFKEVNDTYGHGVGDTLLIAVAGAIKRHKRQVDLAGRNQRQVDNLAGRKGGDEFVLFFDDLDEAEAKIIANRLYKAVAAIRLAQAPELRPSVSIGVAVGIPERKLDWQGITALADEAMYEAKKNKGTDRPTVYIRPLSAQS